MVAARTTAFRVEVGLVHSFEIVFHFRSGSGWQGMYVDGVTVVSRARTLAAMRAQLRSRLAATHGCPEDDVLLEERFELPPGLGELVHSARETRQRVDEERRRSAEITREAVLRLAAEVPGMGMRDIATLVGVSYQRVQQLLRDS